MNYKKIPTGKQYIILGNETQEEIIGVGTYQLKGFVAKVENKKEMILKVFRADRGHKYLSKQYQGLCVEKGIHRQLTIPSTPQQNGVAERMNHILLKMVRSMMVQANLPILFLGGCIVDCCLHPQSCAF